MILYVPLIPTCEPLLNFFWIRPCVCVYIVYRSNPDDDWSGAVQAGTQTAGHEYRRSHQLALHGRRRSQL